MQCWSHIFREGNCCVDLLANMGHSLQGLVWFSVLAQNLQNDFSLDWRGFTRARFLLSFVFCFSVFCFLSVLFFEGLGLVPPSSTLFPFFY